MIPSAHLGSGEDDALDPHPAVVPVHRDLPAEMIVDIALPPGVGDVVLAPDHVGDAEQVVVSHHREVHQRVHVRLHLRVRRGVEDPERGEVPHRRVRVVEIGPDPDRGLALLKAVVEHLLPEFEVLLNRLVAAGAGGLALLELLEVLVVAGADVRPAPLDQLPAEIVVDREAIALGDDFGDTEAEPSDIFLHGLVGFGVHAFRVGILDPEDVPAAVLLHVGIVEGRRPGMADVERARRVGGKPHDDTVFRSLEIGEHLPVLVLLRECGKHLRGPGLEGRHPLFGREGRDFSDSVPGKGRDFLCPAPQLRVCTHDHADHGTGLRHAAVLHRVLECAQKEELFRTVPCHPSDSGSRRIRRYPSGAAARSKAEGAKGVCCCRRQGLRQSSSPHRSRPHR